jgi:multiple sugar transport system substrate-binding protein
MAVGVSGAALSACVAPQASGGGEAAPGQAAIEVGWARHGADTDLQTENALAQYFAEKHPGVTVKPLVLPWEDYNTKIPVMVAGGTAPDTFGCHPALLTETYNANGLIPINDFIDAATNFDYEDVLYHGDADYNGKIVGLPQKSCTHQLRYNKNLFEEAALPTPGELYWKEKEKGWNWNTFAEMGATLTKDLDADGQTDQFFYGGQGGTNILSLIRAAGGEVFNADLTECTLDTAQAAEGLQFMADLVLQHKIQPPPELKADELGINFPTGKIAVAGATTCDSVRDLREGFELPFAWDFVVVPAGPAGFRTWGDTDQIIIASGSKNQQAAFDWMVYRSSKEAWEEAYEKGVKLAFSDGPTRWSIFESKAFTEPLGALDIAMIKEGYNYTIPNPYVPRSPQPYRILFTIMPTEVDNILRGTKTVAEAAADMCTQIEEVLAEKA